MAIKNQDFVLIDFIARIKETIHPKTSKNYRVWPLLNLAVAVCDKELKITHAVRGKDQQDGVKKERIICDYLNWNKPEIIYFGMINFEGMELSKTKIKLAIERNEFDSWEDIRLPFLAALRKRGYKAEALRRFALDLGLTENDKTVDKDEFFKLLNYHQKQIIEKSFRYFMVVDPIEIKLDIKKEILNDDWNSPESVSDEDFIISEREWDNPNHIFFDVLFYKNKEHFGDEDWEDGSFTYEIINIDDLT